MNSSSPASKRVVVAFVVAGIVLRLSGLGVHSVWIDEAATIYVAQSDDMTEVLRGDRHPPLSFLLFRAWMFLFGEADAWLRLAPALASIASLVLLARLAREWLEERAVWIAVAVAAFSPLELWIAREVRMYAFVECAALIAITAAWTHLRRPRLALLALVFAGSAAATGFHYFGAFVGPTVALLAIFVLLSGGAGRKDAFALAVVGILGALVWTPWFVSVYLEQASVPASFLSNFSARTLAELPARLLVPTTDMLPAWAVTSAYAAAAGVTLAFALFVWGLVTRRSTRDSATAIVFATPPACALAAAAVGPLNFLARYFAMSVPGVTLAVAAGIGGLRSRVVRVGFAAALVTLLAVIDVAQHTRNAREDWRGACERIARDFRPGDRVMSLTHLTDPYSQAPLRHYWRNSPELLAALTTFQATRLERSPTEPTSRLHVIYRETRYVVGEYTDLTRRFRVVRSEALQDSIYCVTLE